MKNEKTNSTMTKKTYIILSSVLAFIIILGGRYFGYSFFERIVALIVIEVYLSYYFKKNLKN
ncbi:hypothetical protein N9P06_00845 [Flavobacteriaceae bacterium]|nr:hypothetical protein [Flavobacteriaceae bacterium]MDB4050001.1 hypothetical protein [Flavobacteriaceae bacterium]MDB4240174.1 hypothetical protein [Flavobacteriaceae bacterium]